ncbi:hypothetical protein ACP4OV_016422 [Aristida adscensionis]
MVNPLEQGLATGAANHSLGLLISELHKKVKMWKSVREDCDAMQRDLGIFLAYMGDELRRDARTGVMQAYSDEVRELVHDMEDCIERFKYRITRLDGAGRRRLPRIAHALKTWRLRDLFAREIKKLHGRLQQAGVDRIRHLPDAAAAAVAAAGVGRTEREPIQDSPVGIALAKEELLALLDEVGDETKKLRVIAVVGFGGSGKTTLAYAVYQRTAGSGPNGFPLRAWVDRADYNDASGLLKTIILKFWPQEGRTFAEESNERILQDYLKERLRIQRYLIVLDDMDMEHWRWIELTFKGNGTSSRIIVTTSILPVANLCSRFDESSNSHGYGYVYQMRTLGDEGSQRIALLDELSSDVSSRMLLDKCDGLPLALVSVADHFKSSRGPTADGCKALCDDLGSFLHDADMHGQQHGYERLRAVLMHNYASLSYCMRTCLLYLGIFPDNRCLQRNKIIRRWVAEGYATSNDPRHQQKEADKSFQQFIDRNIIQPVGTSSSRTCKALGIVHEFVLHKSISENFIMSFDAPEQSRAYNGNEPHKKVRHLYVKRSNISSSGATVNIDLSSVRSLTVVTVTDRVENLGSGSAVQGDEEGNGTESTGQVDEEVLGSATGGEDADEGDGSGSAGGAFFKFSKYKMMRVLDLEECIDVNNSHLKDICKLWNLRYLSLGRKVNKLPKEIAQLKLLERIHLSKNIVTELPEDIIGMPCLFHLVGRFILLDHGSKVVSGELVKKCEQCKLETLSGIVADGRQGLLMQLVPHMKSLTKVKICCNPSGDDASHLKNHLIQAMKEYLKRSLNHGVPRSLSIDFASLDGSSLSLSTLEQPDGSSSSSGGSYYYYLRSLKLHGNMLSTVPQFVASLSELTRLCLSLNSVTQDLLSAVGQIGALVHLKLMAYEIPGNLEIDSGVFRSLKSLCFVVRGPNCSIQEILLIGKDRPLPELQSLQLLCKNLAGLCGIEITKLKKLQEIELHPQVGEAARQQWETAARRHPNRPNVLPFLSVDDPAGAAPAAGEGAAIPVHGGAARVDHELAVAPVAAGNLPAGGDEAAAVPAPVGNAAPVNHEPAVPGGAAAAGHQLAGSPMVNAAATARSHGPSGFANRVLAVHASGGS